MSENDDNEKETTIAIKGVREAFDQDDPDISRFDEIMKKRSSMNGIVVSSTTIHCVLVELVNSDEGVGIGDVVFGLLNSIINALKKSDLSREDQETVSKALSKILPIMIKEMDKLEAEVESQNMDERSKH